MSLMKHFKRSYLAGVFHELKLADWSTPKQTTFKTFWFIAFLLLLTGIIAGIDYGFSSLFESLGWN